MAKNGIKSSSEGRDILHLPQAFVCASGTMRNQEVRCRPQSYSGSSAGSSTMRNQKATEH